MKVLFLVLLLGMMPLSSQAESNFQKRLIEILSRNEPTVITEARLHQESEDMINESMVIDPIARFTTYQFGILYALFARPIAITNQATYRSDILSDFSYDPHTNRLLLILTKNIKYSDGTDISAEDIALSISRAAFFRPNLDPYDRIVGALEWRKKPHPLTSYPKGIRVLAQDKVEIIFNKKPFHPYYWLTFPMVSIVPQKCINRKNSSFVCKIPPSSGDYVFENVEKNIATLKKWRNKANIPQKLNIAFVPEKEITLALDHLQPLHIIDIQDGTNFIGGIETRLKDDFYLTGFTQNHIALMLLDHKSVTFQSKEVRFFFASEIRKTLSAMGKETSGSIIPVLNPGYLSLHDLERMHKIEDASKGKALEWLRKHPPSISLSLAKSPQLFFTELLRKTSERLRFNLSSDKRGSIFFRKICYESIDPIHVIRFVLTYGPSYKGRLPKHLFNLIKDISRESPQRNKEININFFTDATLSVLMSYGHQQIYRKDSPFKFQEQFLRQDWQRFFEGISIEKITR